jgi:serine/threonine protein kinase/Flp pilus assembly protein TadD
MDKTVGVPAGKGDALEAAIADYLGRRDRGEAIDVAELIAAHSGCEAGLRQFLHQEQRVHGLASVSVGRERQTGQTIGDFRIVGELGRGGMGVVYEAEQISLGRRVALKVLPFASMLDKQQLARFKNEARAAATLDHPHIVAIHSVGSEGNVHYYAMQLIAGCSLAQVIDSLRRKNQMDAASKKSELAFQSTDARTLTTGVSHEIQLSRGELVKPSPGKLDVERPSALPEYGSHEYFRTAASLGREAATALGYAHQSGVLHRDVKPANLLLDEAAKLWIADFGLARLESDASLTATGDLLGTLRYMSPEQALAQRAVVDQRSDIYSLGITLYELLTLRLAFGESDPALLLQQIAQDEPPAPRKLNPNVPQDLETIVLKAMRKNAQERYFSAQDLAVDLQNFLDDKPINAKRPTLLAIVHRWSRRHRPLVWASVATLLLSGLVVAASAGWTARDRASRRAVVDTTANVAIEEAKSLIEQRRWSQALAAVKRAEDVLMGRQKGPLVGEAAALRKDIEMIVRLDQIPDSDGIMLASEKAREFYDQQYLRFFREYGVDVETLDSATAATRIRKSSIPLQLTLELDKWGTMRRRWASPSPPGKLLFDIARLVDPDPVRNQIRDALEAQTKADRRKTFDQLAVSFDGQDFPLQTTLLLAHTIPRQGTPDQALRFLQTVQRQFPGEFEVNLELGYALALSGQFEEAIRFYTAAVALRPDSGDAYSLRAVVFDKKGRKADALSDIRTATLLDPQNYILQSNLSSLLVDEDPEEAIAAARKALQIEPKSSSAHNTIGYALSNKGQYDEAIAEFREAIRLAPDDARLYMNLCDTLIGADKLDEAIDVSREIIRLAPASSLGHRALGNALVCKYLLDEAISEYKEARRLEPDVAANHWWLGNALAFRGLYDEAVASLRDALSRESDNWLARYVLGNVLSARDGVTDEARREYRQAIEGYRKEVEAQPNNALSLFCLARILTSCEDLTQRDPAAALELATKSVELVPRGYSWRILGRAHYRTGSFQEAVKALFKASALEKDEPTNFFFLAMAEWQLGNQEEAREWYDKGSEWMTRHPQVVGGELVRIRAEAEELLDIPKTDTPEGETAIAPEAPEEALDPTQPSAPAAE